MQILALNPKSILDIGVGFGSKGMLFREYTDIWQGNYRNWKTRIDGIEIFEDYITPLQELIYDNIYIGDAFYFLNTLPYYDLIYMGDIIEHFDKARGKLFLEKMKARGRNIIIATPSTVLKQGPIYGNIYEEHKSQWNPEDFKGAKILTFENILIAKYAT